MPRDAIVLAYGGKFRLLDGIDAQVASGQGQGRASRLGSRFFPHQPKHKAFTASSSNARGQQQPHLPIWGKGGSTGSPELPVLGLHETRLSAIDRKIVSAGVVIRQAQAFTPWDAIVLAHSRKKLSLFDGIDA